MSEKSANKILGEIIQCHICPGYNATHWSDFPDPANVVEPPTIKTTGTDRLQKRIITDFSVNLGSYGMGGPGFLGFELAAADQFPTEWLVLRFWGADSWLVINNALINTHHCPERPKCEFSYVHELVCGYRIEKFECDRRTTEIMIGSNRLFIPDPPWNKHEMNNDADLRDAWILSPDLNIYV